MLNRFALKNTLFIGSGVAMATLGLKGFLLPNGFLDGGATGVSLLLEHLTHWELSIFLLLVNLPFIYLGSQQISNEFALKSSVAIGLLALMVHLVELPTLTNDKLLIAIFGGFFLGAGIGLSIRGGAVIDGTEVLAISISRTSSLSVGDVIALFNICLFSLSAFLLSIETAMYSMLTYLAASKTVDFLLHGIEEYIGLLIVSPKSERIAQHLYRQHGRGVTFLQARKGMGKQGEVQKGSDVLYCVLTRLELSRILNDIEQIDPEAFVVQQSVRDTKGGMIKKRHPFH